MTDRERLVELMNASTGECAHINCGVCEFAKFGGYPECRYKAMANKIIADGWIRTPCKVGTHIWVIPTKENGLTEPTEMVVRGFSIGEPCDVANCFRIRGTCALYQPSFDMFGQSVFFAREEAEKALKGGESDA